MKTLAFFPLAYLADVHGFLLFAPYAVSFLIFTHFLQRIRQSQKMRPQPAMARGAEIILSRTVFVDASRI